MFATTRNRPTLVRAGVIALVALALLVGSCASDDASTAAIADGETATADASSVGSPRPDLPLPELELVAVADLAWPTALASRPGDDGAVYVVEQEGRVWRLALDGDRPGIDEEPVLDIVDEVQINTAGGEPGMLGLEFSPDGRRLYLNHTLYLGEDDGWQRVLVSYVLDDGPPVRAVENSRQVLISYPKSSPHHQGGDLRWGPDGALYSSFGDDNRRAQAQERDNLLGTIVRIDDPEGVDAPAARQPTASTDPGLVAHEIWLLGARNPWRFDFDPLTGDVWVADVGSEIEEEINWIPADRAPESGHDANLGWPLVEGDEEKDGGDLPDNYVGPVHTYPTRGGDRCAVIGGRVYRGSQVPALSGGYLFSDFCGRGLEVVWVHGSAGDPTVEVVDLDLEAPDGVTGFGVGPDGEMFVLTAAGVLLLAPAEVADGPAGP